MPQLANTSSASTSVFARFKRHNTGGSIGSHNVGGINDNTNTNNSNKSPVKADAGEGRSAIDGSGAVEWKGGQLIQHDQITKTQHNHRRDSSILSLTTSVTDSAKGFGANVRRSVSLRSHRTNNSTSGSSFGNNNNTRSPGTAQHSTRLRPASSVEHSDGEEKIPTLPPATAPAAHPLLKRKISLTAKGLSHKFKSTETLPTLNSPAYLHSVRAISPPALERSDSMLLSSQPTHAPLSRKTSEQTRPGLQSQASFTRDIASSHGNGAPLQHVPSVPQGIPGGPLNPNTIYTQIQGTSAKRMATIDYMRKLHEGDIFYFATMHYSQSSLHSMPSMQAHKLGRRATNYFLLGYSLPATLDLNSANPLEYLKALSAVLTEFETYQSLCGFDTSGNIVKNSRMGGMFKSGIRSTKGRRSSTAIVPSDLSIDTRQTELLGVPNKDSTPHSPQEMSSPINPTGHEFSYLLTPHIPFEPDFSTTLGTLCDTLIDTYAQVMELVSGPEMCTPTVGEAFAKADKAIRKILVANVVREFEDTTRAGMKGELAGLGKLTLGGLM